MPKPKAQMMSAEALQLVAERFRVLADPMRLRLLHALVEGEMSVTELRDAVETSQPNVSKHLKILQDAGFVARRQEGNTVYYALADQTVFELCNLVCAGIQKRLAAQTGMFLAAPARAVKRRS
jgi:ArsR family transcriptional regulator